MYLQFVFNLKRQQDSVTRSSASASEEPCHSQVMWDWLLHH